MVVYGYVVDYLKWHVLEDRISDTSLCRITGFYIHSCPKMRYKGEYSPSYLADPEDYSWHHIEECIPLLEKNRYACFTHPEHSIQGDYVGPRTFPHVFDV